MPERATNDGTGRYARSIKEELDMKKQFAALIGIAMISSPVILPTTAGAQDRQYNDRYGDNRWQGDRNGNWDPSNSYREGNYRERRLGPNDRIYRGSDGRTYCKRSNGTTGLVLGGVGGGVLGSVLGGGTLGTLLGAGGGALLGRSLDKNHDNAQNRDNGYRCR